MLVRGATACLFATALQCQRVDKPEAAGAERVIPGVGDIELLFAGDVSIGSRLLEQAREKEASWAPRYPFRNVAERIRRADVAMVNLETVLSGRGARLAGRDGPRAPPGFAEGLGRGGFDVASLANDTIVDWGPEAAQDTAQNLRAFNVSPIGLRKQPARHQEAQLVRVHGQPIAFLAYTAIFPQSYRGIFPGPFPGLAHHMASDVTRAREKAQIIVVSIHFGRAYDHLPTAQQRELASALHRAGATVVVGHGAGVVQPLEVANVQATAFGLGAIVSDRFVLPYVKRAQTGALLSVQLVNGKLAGTKLEPIFQAGDMRPALGGNLDVSSLETAYAPPGQPREDLLHRLADLIVVRGQAPCRSYQARHPAKNPVHAHFECPGGPMRAIGRTAFLSAGVWREVIGVPMEAGDHVTVDLADMLQSDAIVGFAGLEDDATGPAELEIETAKLTLDQSGWQPFRVATPELGGNRRPVHVEIRASGRARVGFRLWTVKESPRQ